MANSFSNLNEPLLDPTAQMVVLGNIISVVPSAHCRGSVPVAFYDKGEDQLEF